MQQKLDNQSETNLKNLYDFFAYKRYDLTYEKESKEELFFARLELRLKIKSRKFAKFCKFEEFTISLNSKSTSIKLNFESIIKSDVVFVASSTFISIFISVSNTKESEAEEISDYTQKAIKQEIAAVVVVAIETVKSEIINLNDIDFFDFIMQVNL